MVAHATCPLTAAGKYVVGAGLYTYSAGRLCISSRMLTRRGGPATLDAGLSLASNWILNAFALAGESFRTACFANARRLGLIGPATADVSPSEHSGSLSHVAD